MKKHLISALSALLLFSQLSAACVYVDCSGSVSSATQQTQQLMQAEFTAINQELATLEENYQKYAEVLDKNNKLYETNKQLKTEYLILLKNINHKVSTIKLMEKE